MIPPYPFINIIPYIYISIYPCLLEDLAVHAQVQHHDPLNSYADALPQVFLRLGQSIPYPSQLCLDVVIVVGWL